MATHEKPILKGKTFEYQVDDIRIRTVFTEEHELHWEYVDAPDGQTGKNASQTFERIPIRDDIVMLAWVEADGTQVLDVWDLGRKVVHSNGVSPDHVLNSVKTTLERVTLAPKQ